MIAELFAIDIGAFQFLGQTDRVDHFIFKLNVCEFKSQLCWVGTFHNHFCFGQHDLKNEFIRQSMGMVMVMQNVVI